jgi:Immunoglobulin domain
MIKQPNAHQLPGKILAGLLLTAVFGLGEITAHAQFLTNGDFEVEPLGTDASLTTFPGWGEGVGSEVVNAPVSITGNYSAKVVKATGGRLYQTLVDTNNVLTQWIFDVDFACSNPGNTTDRTLQLALQTDPSFVNFRQINLRVIDADGNGTGDLQLYNGTAFVTVLANSVTYSASDTSLSMNHLHVVGHYSDATPKYDVFVVNSSNVTNSVLAQTLFQGTKPSAGTTLRQFSFETGNFPSGAFAVVDNVAVTNFGSVNSAPVITSSPTGQTVLQDAATVTFNASFSGTPPLLVQWLFNSNSIAGATNATLSTSTLTLTNVTVANGGSYSLLVSNAFGVAVSSNAVLTVRPVANTAQMTNIWNLLPGSRPYISAVGNTERGLAFNPATSNLLVASRAGGSNSIVVLDPATGAEKHFMNLNGVGGGSIDLNMIGVADDGKVYAGNATTGASAPPYYLYSWDNDSDTSFPIQVFIGDPAASVEPNLRWGDNLAVRGAGANTQILLAPGSGTNVVLLRTMSGLDFQTEIPPAVISISGVPSGFAQLGLAFGPGTNTFWAKNFDGSLRLIQFDLNANTGQVLNAYSDTAASHFQTEVTAIAADNNQKLLAGLAVNETPDNVRLYSVADSTNGPVLRDQELFTVDNPNLTINGTGSAAFGGNYLFVLDSNNGIKAFQINTNYVALPGPFSITSAVPQSGSAVVLTWQSVAGHSYQVQFKNSLTDSTWSNAGTPITATGSTASFTDNVPAASNRFYRVQVQ